MPKRTDIKSILIIGAGPIVIGQACEFDYSGAQACRALKEEGYRVILVNSNPATIMTDPELADRTYIEPINCATVAKIIEKERPDAILPTMGGQTALNTAMELSDEGILSRFNVKLIGVSRDAIDKAENRERFRAAMKRIDIKTPESLLAHTIDEALEAQEKLGFPIVIRPSFTLGGSGGGIAFNRTEFVEIVERGLDLSPTKELLIEQSVLGWKELEMEVVRDCNDNCIIVCSIENLDPMGVHTGDSITVAPAQTLTDKEYKSLCDASIAVLREIGVDTGGSNVQFAINPENGEVVIIEMNPRVSRSSALASKATGFPIAKIATKLAVGYTLDELKNDLTGGLTPASFEPTIDYVVTKVPRFTFEKFPGAEPVLTTQMKSVGEVMAIGRTFQESFQKALRGLEIGMDGLNEVIDLTQPDLRTVILQKLQHIGVDRIWCVADAFRAGFTVDELFEYTQIDTWFLDQIYELIENENAVRGMPLNQISPQRLFDLKQRGFSDRRLAALLNTSEEAVREYRWANKVRPVYKQVDSCAGEFPVSTAYLYSTYEEECEAAPSSRRKIMVLGGGPNRIGQGIEFDYCCVHAALALREDGYETIMINCNPETVSTDYDTSDRLYFEPVTLEDVLEIVHLEKPEGVIVQYGGQTPLKLARDLEKAGVPIIGTSPDSIDLAEDRERFQQLLNKLGLLQPPNRLATSTEQAVTRAAEIGYPIVVRPSYVLGGRAMEVVYDEKALLRYMTTAVSVSNNSPVLLDRYLADAIEVDVDCVCDGKDVFVGGIMEHIEQAGIHSGDSACSIPPYTLSAEIQDRLRVQVRQLAVALNTVGLMNTQFAVKGDDIYILEVNPRAARTIPFVAKSIGIPLAKVGARCMAGQSLQSQAVTAEVAPSYYSVKESVFPFNKFQGVDPILGPEMKSTGEVMGLGLNFAQAYAKSQLGAGSVLPKRGKIFISVRNDDKAKIIDVARQLVAKGYTIGATRGTNRVLKEAGIESEKVNKVLEGRPHIVDMLKNGEIAMIINTSDGQNSVRDSYAIRREALNRRVCYTTTINGAIATLMALDYLEDQQVICLQDIHKVNKEASS